MLSNVSIFIIYTKNFKTFPDDCIIINILIIYKKNFTKFRVEHIILDLF